MISSKSDKKNKNIFDIPCIKKNESNAAYEEGLYMALMLKADEK